jgi:hypothetical protein
VKAPFPCSVGADLRRYLDDESARAAAAGERYAYHLHEARDALLRDPSRALRNPSSRQYPTLRASDLYEWITEEQQQAVAEIVARAARESDPQAMKLIDALARDHAERNADEEI